MKSSEAVQLLKATQAKGEANSTSKLKIIIKILVTHDSTKITYLKKVLR